MGPINLLWCKKFLFSSVPFLNGYEQYKFEKGLAKTALGRPERHPFSMVLEHCLVLVSLSVCLQNPSAKCVTQL